jgi:hypothetical protein
MTRAIHIRQTSVSLQHIKDFGRRALFRRRPSTFGTPPTSRCHDIIIIKGPTRIPGLTDIGIGPRSFGFQLIESESRERGV